MYTDMRNTYIAMNLDVVVNNPDINMTGKDTHTVDEAFFDRLININLKSVYHSITACTPVYVVRWIVLIFSELDDFLAC
jgi:NAD(P)-dependent dehydrogenase (short-subunit alcohol dehydrogenase family)